MNRYGGIRYIKETIKLDDLTMPANGNDFAGKFTCDFGDISQLQSYLTVSPRTAIQALYARYCITGVKYTFIPQWTTSGVGSLKANTVLYAINRDPQDTTSSERDLIRQNDCKFTNTNRKFTVYIKHPTPALASTSVHINQNPSAGYDSSQYPTPVGGAGGGGSNPNQVAASLQGRKWIWLPTRVEQYNSQGGATSDQWPDHFGLDVYVKSNNPDTQTAYSVYSVYQTIYLALKEQD